MEILFRTENQLIRDIQEIKKIDPLVDEEYLKFILTLELNPQFRNDIQSTRKKYKITSCHQEKPNKLPAEKKHNLRKDTKKIFNEIVPFPHKHIFLYALGSLVTNLVVPAFQRLKEIELTSFNNDGIDRLGDNKTSTEISLLTGNSPSKINHLNLRINKDIPIDRVLQYLVKNKDHIEELLQNLNPTSYKGLYINTARDRKIYKLRTYDSKIYREISDIIDREFNIISYEDLIKTAYRRSSKKVNNVYHKGT